MTYCLSRPCNQEMTILLKFAAASSAVGTSCRSGELQQSIGLGLKPCTTSMDEDHLECVKLNASKNDIMYDTSHVHIPEATLPSQPMDILKMSAHFLFGMYDIQGMQRKVGIIHPSGIPREG